MRSAVTICLSRWTGFHAEWFANGDADGWRGLHDDDFFRIGDGVIDTSGILLNEGAGWADGNALAAMYTAGFEQWAFKRWHDDGVKAEQRKRAPTFCTSLHMVSQRRHMMHYSYRARGGVGIVEIWL